MNQSTDFSTEAEINEMNQRDREDREAFAEVINGSAFPPIPASQVYIWRTESFAVLKEAGMTRSNLLLSTLLDAEIRTIRFSR